MNKQSQANRLPGANGTGVKTGPILPNEGIQLDMLEKAGIQARMHLNQTLSEQLNTMGILLVKRKELPPFYFYDAAAEMGLEPAEARQLRAHQWPPRKELELEQLTLIVEAYLKVTIRLYRFPEWETYRQAADRLRQRVAAVKDRGYTHNQIAQDLHLSFRELQGALRPYKDNAAIKHSNCPWNMLRQLEGAEERLAGDQAKNRDSRRSRRRERRANDPVELKNTLPDINTVIANLLLIQPGDPCAACGANGKLLVNEGADAWGNIVMVCPICAKENRISLETMEEAPPEPREFIRRYNPCWYCSMPWNNLKRDGEDEFGNAILTCENCRQTNRIAPEEIPEPAGAVGRL